MCPCAGEGCALDPSTAVAGTYCGAFHPPEVRGASASDLGNMPTGAVYSKARCELVATPAELVRVEVQAVGGDVS